MFSSRHSSWMLFSPRYASRRIRIFSSVVYRLPSMSVAFLCWPQTNTSHGPKKRGHVTPGKFAIHRRRPAIPTTVFSKHGKDTAQRGFKKPLPCPQKGVEREPDQPDAKAILPEPWSVQKANSYQFASALVPLAVRDCIVPFRASHRSAQASQYRSHPGG